MGQSILIKYYDDLRYSLVPSDVLIDKVVMRMLINTAKAGV